jgi:lipoprotein NlpI
MKPSSGGRRGRWALVLLACLAGTGTAAGRGQAPQDFVDRAVEAYAAGRPADALASFDALIALVPPVRPELWQRGIVLYELGRFAECAEQFRAFHDVSPDDVEDAAWHFFCVARAQSPAAARVALLPVRSDPRVMRPEVYGMLRGQLTPDDLVDAAGGLPIALFYAHLYGGLYLEAVGDRAAALAHLNEAVRPEYAEYGGFMNIAAHVHRDALARPAGTPATPPEPGRQQ